MLVEYNIPLPSRKQDVSVLNQWINFNDENDILFSLNHHGFFNLLYHSSHIYDWLGIQRLSGEKIPLQTIHKIIEFDKSLRLLIFGHIETIEISFKEIFSYNFSQKHGVHCYRDENLCKNRENFYINDQKLNNEIIRSNDSYIKNLLEIYTLRSLPLAHVKDTFSFGLAVNYYDNLNDLALKNQISRHYSLDIEVFTSWLKHINEIRNVCAHHGRLWNRSFTRTPITHRKSLGILTTEFILNNRHLYNSLIILIYFANKLNQPNFKINLLEFLKTQTSLLPFMGFPQNWQTLDTFS